MAMAAADAWENSTGASVGPGPYAPPLSSAPECAHGCRRIGHTMRRWSRHAGLHEELAVPIGLFYFGFTLIGNMLTRSTSLLALIQRYIVLSYVFESEET
jgi:hypothetical protein